MAIQKVVLGKMQLKDADRMAKLMNNRDVQKNLRDHIPFPYANDDARQFIITSNILSPPLNLGIYFDQKLVGVIGITINKSTVDHEAEIGYWIGKPFWNKGITTQALRQMVEYVFDQFDLEIIFATVFIHNRPSMRVLTKSGFIFEHIVTDGYVKQGKPIDLHYYKLTKRHYLALNKQVKNMDQIID